MLLKKLSISSLITILLLTGFSTSSFAQTEKQVEKEQLLYKKSEIKDIDKLWDRAKNGVNDPKVSSEDLVAKSDLVLTGSKANVSRKYYQTTQLLEVKKEGETTTKYFATTTFAVVQGQDTPENQIGTLASSSDYDYKWDSSLAVKAYSTIYFENKYDSSNVKHYDMTSVTGGWSYDGSGNYVLSGRHVRFGQVGPSSFGGTSTQIKNYYPTGNTWSYTVPSTWYGVVATKYTTCGVNSWINISRGTSSWSLEFLHSVN
ncbi:hypothetical protein [Gottfriedia acidiceleris]|uniref:hypothetical protein n=1 Tax=Gottfriedia acidiceleris TaxID=371036 RepID=UPI00101BA02E|nr:hypothetical protein [Gottfriedia acidiceleris]